MKIDSISYYGIISFPVMLIIASVHGFFSQYIPDPFWMGIFVDSVFILFFASIIACILGLLLGIYALFKKRKQKQLSK